MILNCMLRISSSSLLSAALFDVRRLLLDDDMIESNDEFVKDDDKLNAAASQAVDSTGIQLQIRPSVTLGYSLLHH